MMATPGATYSHDVLWNRTGKVSGGVTTSYSWDAVNRMDVYATTAGSSGYKNQYRPDGMRVKKETGWTVSGSPGAYVVNDLGSGLQTRTYYDGQMPVEEDEGPRGGSVAKWTRNFVGARGIEAMVSFDGSVTTTAFPLYDCHGNMVATVARSGSAFSVGNVRTYDVWGSVRNGAATGGPRGRYVANLGHVVDDESGLIYMRARFYEPGSGRFISEDPARDGVNWFVYCLSNPVNYNDPTGKFLDVLISTFMDILDDTANAGFQQAAKNYAKHKIEDIMIKKMGQVLGALASTEFDILNAQIDTRGYLELHLGKYGRVGIDFTAEGLRGHGTPHIDLNDGAVQKIGTRRLSLFIDGFFESFL